MCMRSHLHQVGVTIAAAVGQGRISALNRARVAPAGARGELTPPRMTRDDRATSRAELRARVERLLAATPGPRALEALGAHAICWQMLSTGAGFVPLTGAELAQALGVDERTWAGLARLLIDAGLLAPMPRGYQVVGARELEGTAGARGTTGFLRTYRPAYAEAVARVRTAAAGRRGAYVLAALGAFELVRVLHASWRTGKAVLPAAAAARAYGVSEKTWLGYVGLLGRALLLDRVGSRIRVLGWARLCLGPAWRRTVPAMLAAAAAAHNLPVPVDEQTQKLPDLSAAKARAEGKNFPLPPRPGPAARSPGGPRPRRGDHPNLDTLLGQLEARVPAAGQARWRRPVRAQLSHALAAAGGDVAGLAAALLRRDLAAVRDVPSVLAYRCAGAVEIVRARQAAQAAAAAAAEARTRQKEAAADAAAQRQDEVGFGTRVAAAAGGRYLELLDRVAVELGQPRPGAPTFRGGVRRAVEALAHTRVREAAETADLATHGDHGRVSERSASSTSQEPPMRAAEIPDLMLVAAVEALLAQTDAARSTESAEHHDPKVIGPGR